MGSKRLLFWLSIMVSLVAGLAGAAAAAQVPYLAGGRVCLPFTGNYLTPGSTMNCRYTAVLMNVAALRTSFTLPPGMQLVKKGSAPYRLVDGKPTWTVLNQKTPVKFLRKRLYFRVKILPGTKPGPRYITFKEIASSGSWRLNRTTDMMVVIKKAPRP